MGISRRQFVFGLGAAAVVSTTRADGENWMAANESAGAGHGSCPFRLAVINDEISQDFGHACEVAAKDFGLSWIELRSMWNKNLADLDAREIAEARRILEKNNLRVTDLASPLFKVEWPGAPISSKIGSRDQFHADFDFEQQGELLDRMIAVAKEFQTDRIRCFDFWRLEDPKPFLPAIHEKLQSAAAKCAGHGMILLLENEMTCNTATGAEAARTLAGVPNKNFMLNWDPGNAAMVGATPYPNGYDLLPKDRIGHCHCKDVSVSNGKRSWAPVGSGVVDWVGQFRALQKQGYHYAVSLETHWRGAGTPEASSRISMQGLKKTLQKAGINCG